VLNLRLQVALERIKEYSDLPTEPPEYIEPRPPAAWPTSGSVRCENLSVRYAVSDITLWVEN